MSGLTCNCPKLRREDGPNRSSAVQTTCPFCKSILVRHDVDLTKVSGRPAWNSSPIQLGTTGVIAGIFSVVERIMYEYERGGWSEWHLRRRRDERVAGDAMAEYAISQSVSAPNLRPNRVRVGASRYAWNGRSYETATITPTTVRSKASCRSKLGTGRMRCSWISMRMTATSRRSTTATLHPRSISASTRSSTICASAIFGSRGLVTAPNVKALTCPKCGAAITLRTGAQAQVVVCEHCHAVLDATDPNLKVLQTFDDRMRWKTAIPLGTKGTLGGDAYEAIGFQVRSIVEDDVTYSWREYVLWNPYKGYRYLSEYDGHWNDYSVTKTPPTPVPGSEPPVVELHGERFKHFQTAEASTVFILGEFPWQVRVGDKATVSDYVEPPHMLSKEVTEDETTWSIGNYTDPRRIWAAFSLPGAPPAPLGVYENQPDNYLPAAKSFLNMFAVFALLLFALFIARQMTAANASVFTGSYSFRPPGSDSGAFVTAVLPIAGRTSNVEVQIQSNVNNSWALQSLADQRPDGKGDRFRARGELLSRRRFSGRLVGRGQSGRPIVPPPRFRRGIIFCGCSRRPDTRWCGHELHDLASPRCGARQLVLDRVRTARRRPAWDSAARVGIRYSDGTRATIP